MDPTTLEYYCISITVHTWRNRINSVSDEEIVYYMNVLGNKAHENTSSRPLQLLLAKRSLYYTEDIATILLLN